MRSLAPETISASHPADTERNSQGFTVRWSTACRPSSSSLWQVREKRWSAHREPPPALAHADGTANTKIAAMTASEELLRGGDGRISYNRTPPPARSTHRTILRGFR